MKHLLIAAALAAFSGAAHAGPWDGTWSGDYICGQGRTALTLVLRETTPGQIAGEFRFGPTPGNPAVPKGAFRVLGMAQGSAVTLSGVSWIEQPTGYGMVSLQGAASGDAITGAVLSPTCKGFSVMRVRNAEFVAKPADPPPAPKPAAPKPVPPKPKPAIANKPQ